jgi:hypothetical protein
VHSQRSFTLAAAAAAVVAIAAAVILLNLTLLGYAQPRDDPVGSLSPNAPSVEPRTSTPAPPTEPRASGESDD